MEKSTALGLLAGLALVSTAIMVDDGWQAFFDFSSFLIVGGGTAAALLVSCSLHELRQVPGLLREFFLERPAAPETYVPLLGDLARTGRREGLVSLESRIPGIADRMLRFGLEQAVDGSDEERIDEMMYERMTAERARLQIASRFFSQAGSFAPAFGMIGTLIGLIQMLHRLNTPDQIGSAMAVALVTTFYGALLANVVCLPLANRLRLRTAEIMRNHEMIRMGIVAIVRGDTPLALERQLQAFLTQDPAPPVRKVPLARVA